jgi:hypothetical protein
VSFTLTLVAALASSGCPELNRQPDHAADPMFNVDDPTPAATPAAVSTGVMGSTQFMISQQGGLPDQARRAH